MSGSSQLLPIEKLLLAEVIIIMALPQRGPFPNTLFTLLYTWSN